LSVTSASREALAIEVREALDALASRDPDGLIQPEAVVEEAKSNPDSPLHRQFDWDVERSAYQHWLAVARSLIARYTVIRIDEGPKYVNVRISQRRGYVSIERAVADPDLFQQIVTEAEKAIVGWRNRLSAFEKARPAVAALDEAVGELRASKARKATPKAAAGKRAA
jgi:hypothetical protein